MSAIPIYRATRSVSRGPPVFGGGPERPIVSAASGLRAGEQPVRRIGFGQLFILGVTDANSYAYDRFDRLATATYPDASTEAYAYDA